MEEKRPVSISVVSWIFIIQSGLDILLLSVALILVPMLKLMGLQVEVVFLFQNVGFLLGWAMLILSIFVFIAAVRLLKLRAWARTVLETACWLFLVYIAGWDIFMIFSFVSTPATHRDMLITTIIAASIISVVPVALIIKILRSKKFKEVIIVSKF